ncbi:MAG: putative DNA binding domain-containing protein [Candidatus Omnitrophica bacterium]|nr:putative DNA binding domain-containing protein [Candidatus Omnitrophota bacterium]
MKKAVNLIKAGESTTVEFKSSFDKNAVETLVAFANTRGGDVLIGVSDRGEIKGIQISKETVQNWINEVKQHTSQAITPDVETIKIKDRNIVIFSVPESPIKPVASKGRYYKRIKNANHQLTASEVAAMHLRTFNTSWDFHIDERHTKKDISLKKVRAFIKQANTNREAPIQDEPTTVLQKLEFIRDNKITYACFLLFMSGESSLSTIELGRFQTPIIIKDGSRLKTDLFTEVEGVMAFVKKHINKAYIITGRPQREERWDYPLDAIREIVINAIIHRDYTSAQDSVVKVYDDKIEFFNPGGLPAGLTVEKLLKGNYISNVRNKKIADAFKAAGLIEKYGSGIKRILNAFKAYGLPAPEFEETSGGFLVTAYKKPGQVIPQVTGDVGAKLGASWDQVRTKSGLSPEEVIRTLVFCSTAKAIQDIQKEFEWANRTKFRNKFINPLLSEGLLEMSVPDKPQSRLQKYRLTENGRKLLEKLRK